MLSNKTTYISVKVAFTGINSQEIKSATSSANIKQETGVIDLQQVTQ